MSGGEDQLTYSHCASCAFEQLEALYQLNVEAKRYAEATEQAYLTGRKATARLYSLRKTALYGLKRVVLGTLVENGCVDTVRCHEINGKSYYCFYVGEFSFQSPTDEFEEPPSDVSTTPTKTLDSFDADPDNRDDHLSEQGSLARLAERFETPNHHLPTPFVDREQGFEFAGWSQLPGAIEEGDRVDGRFGRERSTSDHDFLFAVGDDFRTREGKCHIFDRYRAWLTPWFDRSPMRPRPAYDVELAGEIHETVRQRRIIDDWRVLAESLQDPVPHVDGRQAELAGDADVEFDVGDTVELDPEWDDSGPNFYKIAEASLSYNLVMVDFEAVGPTGEAPLSRSVEEFADAVVAIHDVPPKPE